MIKKYYSKIFKGVFITMFLFPLLSYAQKFNVQIDNPFKGGSSLMDIVTAVVNNIILPVGGVVAVLAFIYSGFLFVTAQGNGEKIKDAKATFFATVVGTAILLGSWVLANAIKATISSLM